MKKAERTRAHEMECQCGGGSHHLSHTATLDAVSTFETLQPTGHDSMVFAGVWAFWIPPTDC